MPALSWVNREKEEQNTPWFLKHYLEENTAAFENRSTGIKTFGNLMEKGGGPPTSFSPVTSTNVGIMPQFFLTFSFNPFDRLM